MNMTTRVITQNAEWTAKGVAIQPSPVHGVGVFAKIDIPQGTRLAPFHGVEMSLRDFKAKYGSDTRRSYSLRRQNKIIDGKDVENLSHHCNESETPNVVLKSRALYTSKDIAQGEELFLKYPNQYPRDYALSIPEATTTPIPPSQWDEWMENKTWSDADLRKDFKSLIKCDVDDNPGLKKSGGKIVRSLFIHHIIKTKTKTGVSFYEAMHDPNQRQKYIDLQTKYKRSVYQAFSLWNGCINAFRPTTAKWLYTKYNAKVGVLDFSAGWGGRCLAAMAVGVPYHGIDTNVDLRDPYLEMVEKFNVHKVEVNMTWQPAETVDFSGWDYDMIMTSPPYGNIEQYRHMPEYGGDFNNRFLLPTVVQAFTHLRPGGHMALNMPEPMYLAVKDALPHVHEILDYPKYMRNQGLKDGKKKPVAHEAIYVWRK